MRKYSLQQYQDMAKRFNQKSFTEKIETIKENSDILTLASDGNWWVVKVKEKAIQDDLYDTDTGFVIVNEWGSSEMDSLVSLLGLSNTDI